MLNFTNNGRLIAAGTYNGVPTQIYMSDDNPYSKVKYIEETNPLICPYCEKIYSTKHHKKRHYDSCAVKYLLDKNNKTSLYFSNCFPIPNTRIRDCIYIAGPAGAGKTTWCRQYIEKFHNMKPDYNIIVISSIAEDNAFKGLPCKIQQLELSEIKKDIKNKEDLDYLDIENFRKSLIIFDDIEYRDRQISNILLELLYDCIQNGRDHTYQDEDIYLLITSHKLTNYRKTRLILDEATGIVVFPNSQGKATIIKYAERYLNMKKKDINKMLNTNSRWLYIAKSTPPYLIYDDSIRCDITY